MKLYMIKKVDYDGKTRYRAAGVYDKWTPSGKCWSGGSFKGFLNYSKLTTEKLLTQECFVVEINLDDNLITETPIKHWFEINMN